MQSRWRKHIDRHGAQSLQLYFGLLLLLPACKGRQGPDRSILPGPPAVPLCHYGLPLLTMSRNKLFPLQIALILVSQSLQGTGAQEVSLFVLKLGKSWANLLSSLCVGQWACPYTSVLHVSMSTFPLSPDTLTRYPVLSFMIPPHCGLLTSSCQEQT